MAVGLFRHFDALLTGSLEDLTVHGGHLAYHKAENFRQRSVETRRSEHRLVHDVDRVQEAIAIVQEVPEGSCAKGRACQAANELNSARISAIVRANGAGCRGASARARGDDRRRH